MASQDMFQDIGSTQKSMDSGRGKSEYLYEYIILFNWNVDLKAPFSYHKISEFNENDIKPEWISKNLGVNSRVCKLRNLGPFPGQVMSLFGKIELGEIY